jgi:hypothetical protein
MGSLGMQLIVRPLLFFSENYFSDRSDAGTLPCPLRIGLPAAYGAALSCAFYTFVDGYCTTQLYVAGVGSTFPAGSSARTWKLGASLGSGVHD